MGAGAFTTWSDLARTMRDDLASGNWRTVHSYSVGGPAPCTLQSRSLPEFMGLLAMVEARAAQETSPGFNGQLMVVTRGGF